MESNDGILFRVSWSKLGYLFRFYYKIWKKVLKFRNIA
jgi:hypothetical protein